MQDPQTQWLEEALHHLNTCTKKRRCQLCAIYNMRVVETRPERLGPIV